MLASVAAMLICGREAEPTRMAIRVDCSEPRACELAESVALDVWSEQRGAGLPLDVVVRSDMLRRLEDAGVRWQTLVPDIDAAARAEAERLRAAAHEQRYRLLQGVELYPSAGTISDWAYGELDALSFTIELRPRMGRGAGGFVLPPDQIRPTCDEGLASVLAMRSALP